MTQDRILPVHGPFATGTLAHIAEHEWVQRTAAGPLPACMQLVVGLVVSKSAFVCVHCPLSILGLLYRVLGFSSSFFAFVGVQAQAYQIIVCVGA